MAPEPQEMGVVQSAPSYEHIYNFLTRHYIPHQGLLARKMGDYPTFQNFVTIQSRLLNANRFSPDFFRRVQETRADRNGEFDLDYNFNPILPSRQIPARINYRPANALQLPPDDE